MKFYNRKKEIEIFDNLNKYRLAIVGRRRVGKTRLVEEYFTPELLTFFISSGKSEQELISMWVNTYPDEGLPNVTTLTDFFKFLINYKQEKIIFIDEIQNAIKVKKSFISDLQRLLDTNPEANIVVSGSLIRTMKDVIMAMKSPLFGRFDLIIKLDELDFHTVVNICHDLGLDFEAAIKMYLVFGGIPKYYELIEHMKTFDFNKFIKDMFIFSPRPFYSEVKIMLIEEFGGQHHILFSILSAISQGKNRMSEIGSVLGRKETKITKYIQMLKEDFEILRHMTPILYGKRGIYEINTNIVDFWFANIWKYQQYLEVGEEVKLSKIMENNLQRYFGRKFEGFIIELFRAGTFNFEFDVIGRQWGTLKDKPKGMNQYEIDIIATSSNYILFGECKWSSGINANNVIKELDKKAKGIDTLGRKVEYAIFAKDFSKRISEYKKIKTYCFGLKDIEQLILKK